MEKIPTIKDSGERREFGTGAVRDIQEGKGRCDLLPLDVIAEAYGIVFGKDDSTHKIFNNLYMFVETGEYEFLIEAMNEFNLDSHFKSWSDMILEVSKHFEEGAKKYGEHNWQKGIPVRCYIDSATRHYLKFLRKDDDEPHDRAFVWNLMCCMWTCIHKPELNDYRKD